MKNLPSNTKREPALFGHPVQDPANWQASDLKSDERWVYHVEQRELSQIFSMARSIRSSIGDDPNGLLSLPAAAFNFGAFTDKIRMMREELKDGLGAVLIRGLPLDEIDSIDTATIYWGIGRHLGVACSNNPEGEMLGHVTDKGKTQKDPNSRGYQTSEEMSFHCDQSSIVGLLCLRTPMSGGISKISSSVALYNEMLRRDPESVQVLSQPFYWTKHGEVNEGEPNYYTSPVFNFIDGVLCTSLGPMHIKKGHDLPETPDLTSEQLKALELAKNIAEEQHFAMELERGDIQLLNNSVVLHTRTAYQDFPEPEKKRLLWRLWLVERDIRPLTPYIKQWNAGVKLNSTMESINL
jgi:hypothetical protein